MVLASWKNIHTIWNRFNSLISFKVGDGARTFFWHDPWLSSQPLKMSFPLLFRISLYQDGSIADFWDGTHHSWNITFRRLLKDVEITQFQDLMDKIYNFTISPNSDSRTWSLESSGFFTVRSLSRHMASSPSIEKFLFQALWKSKSPKRINILIWIMIFGNLNTTNILQRKMANHALMPSICHYAARMKNH